MSVGSPFRFLAASSVASLPPRGILQQASSCPSSGRAVPLESDKAYLGEELAPAPPPEICRRAEGRRAWQRLGKGKEASPPWQGQAAGRKLLCVLGRSCSWGGTQWRQQNSLSRGRGRQVKPHYLRAGVDIPWPGAEPCALQVGTKLPSWLLARRRQGSAECHLSGVGEGLEEHLCSLRQGEAPAHGKGSPVLPRRDLAPLEAERGEGRSGAGGPLCQHSLEERVPSRGRPPCNGPALQTRTGFEDPPLKEEAWSGFGQAPPLPECCRLSSTGNAPLGVRGGACCLGDRRRNLGFFLAVRLTCV